MNNFKNYYSKYQYLKGMDREHVHAKFGRRYLFYQDDLWEIVVRTHLFGFRAVLYIKFREDIVESITLKRRWGVK